MAKLKCDECGNDKEFYREVSIVAKIKVDNNDKTIKGSLYDINENLIDNEWDTTYCAKCKNAVDETSI